MSVAVRARPAVLKRGSEATMIQIKVRVNLYIVVTPKDPKLLFLWTRSSAGQSISLLRRRSQVRILSGSQILKKKQMGKNKPNIFKGRTKEWDMEKGKFRQYRSNQGRSPERMESSYKIMGIAIVGLVLIFLFLLISQ